MAVHAVGSTGDKGTQVAPGVDSQLSRVLRENGIDFDHLIGQRLPQHTEKEQIALFQEVKIGKHLLSGKAAVTGQHTMRPEATYRERGAEQVAHAPVEGTFLCAVVDRQIDADSGDLHIAHQSVLPHIQERVVALRGFDKGVLRVGLFRDRHKGLVVFLRFGAGSVQRRGVHLFDGFRVLRFNEAAVFLGEVVGDQRVQDHAEGNDEQDGQR